MKALTLWNQSTDPTIEPSFTSSSIDNATPYQPINNTPKSGSGSTHANTPGTGSNSGTSTAPTGNTTPTQKAVDDAQNQTEAQIITAVKKNQSDIKDNTDRVADVALHDQKQDQKLADQQAAQQRQQEKNQAEIQRVQQKQAEGLKINQQQATYQQQRMMQSLEKRLNAQAVAARAGDSATAATAKGYTDTKSTQAVTTSNTYTDNAVSNINTSTPVDPDTLNQSYQNQADAQALNGNHGNSAPTNTISPAQTALNDYVAQHSQELWLYDTDAGKDLSNLLTSGGLDAVNKRLESYKLPDLQLPANTSTTTPATTTTAKPVHVKLAQGVNAHEAQSKDPSLRAAYAKANGLVIDHTPPTETQAEKDQLHKQAVDAAQSRLNALKAKDNATTTANTVQPPVTSQQVSSNTYGQDIQTLVKASNDTNDRVTGNAQNITKNFNQIQRDSQRIDTNRQDIDQNHADIITESHARYEGDRATLQQSESYTDQKVNGLKSEVQDNRKRADAGSASGLAAVGIPGLYGSQSWNFGAGVGSFGDAQAVAVGGNYKVSEHVAFKVGATASPTTQNYGAFAGVAIGN